MKALTTLLVVGMFATTIAMVAADDDDDDDDVEAVVPVRDVQIAPGVATHMGQVASDHVVLHSVSIATDEFEFKRLFPDGSGDLVTDSAFVVPADKVFVATDVSVGIEGTFSASYRIQISIASLDNPPVFESHFFSASGDGGTNDGLTSGFIVAPGQQIFALQTVLNGGAPGTSQTTIIVRGYLAANE